jgi:hypothetical protein
MRSAGRIDVRTRARRASRARTSSTRRAVATRVGSAIVIFRNTPELLC